MSKQIQWFPGHMVKALKEIKQQLQAIDLIIVITDARAPLSSLNPELFTLIKDKPRIMILSKKDLANKIVTKDWINYFTKNGYFAKDFNLNNENIKPTVLKMIKEATKVKREKMIARGYVNFNIRAMVIGIPNVGKSTFINQMANRKASKVGNLPGVTRAQQLIKITSDCELLDTPGILWPKFEDHLVGVRLALIGTIKNEILPHDELIEYLINYLNENKLDYFEKRYGVVIPHEIDSVTITEIIEKIGIRRGLLQSQGTVDFDRCIQLILKEFKEGILGPISLEYPGNQNGKFNI